MICSWRYRSFPGGCPESHYCETGTTDPVECPAGTYNDVIHRHVCPVCPAGYYCPANSTTYTDTACPTGQDNT